MNNFEENNEFVRRPQSSAQNDAVNRAPGDEVRRPVMPSGAGAPQARPQNARPRPSAPSQNRNMQSTGTQGRPAQPSSRIAPDRKSQTVKQQIKRPEPKAKKEFDKSEVLRNVLIFLGMLAAMLLLSFVLVLSSLHVAPEKVKTNYSYVYGESGDKAASVTVNKVLYVNMSDLSEMYKFTVSGTKAALRFTADKGEYAEFTIGSVSARINGDIVNMEGAALVRENENVWIPLSFVENYFGGILTERDEKENIITISREKKAGSTEDAPLYADITFRIKGSQTLGGIGEDPYIGEIKTPEFINDLSAYKQYMNPENRDDYLILVNKTNTISADDIPENLVSIVNVRKDGRKEQMVECAEKALEALYIEMKSAGYTDVSVMSGYRSYNKQVSLFSTYLQREMANNPSLTEEQAKQIVLTYSAFPGTSEHQTGLCCDMHNLPSADVSFANKAAYTWLKENCHKFGFIIRYPEDKTEITGYSFEPWHYRFVGRYHATRMYELGMCLEEYVELLARADNN